MSTAKPTKILVVEDEPMILDAVATRLRAEGYDVATAIDGPSGLTAFREAHPALAVLDVMLPGFDGFELCRLIQAQSPIPVLMLTARDDEADIVNGLAFGADDYLTKPFRMQEFVARCAALLRRIERSRQLSESHQTGSILLETGPLRINLAARQCFVNETAVKLTSTEFELLAMLAGRPGEVITRDELMTEIWDWANAKGTRTLDSHVKALRAKVGADHIRTCHGVGYAWEATP